MTQKSKTQPRSSVGRTRWSIAIGLASCALLVGGAGIWSTTAKLSSAVVTNGQVVVSSETKVVQHPDGGVVGTIKVRNGDHVAAGDVVMTLDDSLLKKNRDLVDGQLVALMAQQARLEAERHGNSEITPGAELAARMDEPAVRSTLDLQTKVMTTGAAARAGQVKTYELQIAQLQDQIKGLETQRDANTTSITLIDDELGDLQPLYEKGLVQKNRITGLQRARNDLDGTQGSLSSQIAMAKGQISETRQKIAQVQAAFDQDTITALEALAPQIAKLEEQRAATELQLSRVDIRAPSDGIVNHLAVHTVGGVIAPGETLMEVVPTGDNLVVRAMVMPKDINNIAIGQNAKLVISAFDHNTTPEILGQVSYISADLTSDAQQQVSYYDVRVALDDSTSDELALTFLPGMQAEVFISAGEKTLAQYLMDPLQTRLNHTFREV